MSHQEKLLPNHKLQEEPKIILHKIWEVYRCPEMQLNTYLGI